MDKDLPQKGHKIMILESLFIQFCVAKCFSLSWWGKKEYLQLSELNKEFC